MGVAEVQGSQSDALHLCVDQDCFLVIVEATVGPLFSTISIPQFLPFYSYLARMELWVGETNRVVVYGTPLGFWF